jgi:hypothetical protein
LFEIKLDTHKLLAGLVEQAARIATSIATVAQSSRSSSSVKVPSMRKSASYGTMPPPPLHAATAPVVDVTTTTTAIPPRRMNQVSSHGLHLLCRAAASGLPVVVSPDICSWGVAAVDTMNDIPALRLEAATACLSTTTPLVVGLEKADSHMSFDQCADIVDNILDDLDASVFTMPRKKAKIGNAF